MRLRQPRRTVRFIPHVEFLEVRSVPTCTAFQTGNILTVNGTPGPDRVQIGDDGIGDISLLCDGDQPPRLFHGIAQVNVHTHGGADLVHYDLLGNVTGFHALNVDLGTGNDRFVAFLNRNGLFSGADYGINVRGHGRDNLSVDTGKDPNTQLVAKLSQGLNLATFLPFAPGPVNFGSSQGTDIAQRAIMRLNLAGGPGKDTISVKYEGTIAGAPGVIPAPLTPANPVANQGTLSVVLNGGKRNDVLVAHILADAGSAGRVFARESGAAGNDNLTLTVRQRQGTGVAQTQVVTVDALIDGGSGHNRCRRTPNVSAVNCQTDVLEPVFLPDGEFAPPFLPPIVIRPGGPTLRA